MKSLFGFGPTFMAKDLKALGIFLRSLSLFFFSLTPRKWLVTGALLQLRDEAGTKWRGHLRVENSSLILTSREKGRRVRFIICGQGFS